MAIYSGRVDLDLRLVRYFTVVAEHGNFGRAATALHLAQPSLSRQIQRLEDQLGVRLLDRTPQGSSLTDAGRVFLSHAQALLHTAEQATRAAKAADPPRAITIGYVEGLVITPAVQALRRRHPDARIRTRHLAWNATHALPERRVDALIARRPLPFPTDHLRVRTLYREPRVLVVPVMHRLAGKESADLGELADEELVACKNTPTIWSTPRPVGDRPAPPGPAIEDSFEDKLELIATGHSVAILPAGDRRATVRDDIALVPLDGIEPCEVVLVTRAHDPNPLIKALKDATLSHLTG
ncbi:LysR family transcriptional regulator [Nocardia sp. NPDC051570]|uniref:LysR family transcriptional regulator n=1 Tax=Nocardia sp. NPDC051570 TaxID=3364324 RepID=UPI0037B118CF